MRPDEKGKKLANDILDYVNNLACNEEIFAKTICGAHRALQQSAMRLFIATICKMAENDTDARNEASVELAKKIAEIAKDHSLPLV